MSEQASFESALKKLEESVSRLEEGQLPLDEALACFESGVQSANQCRTLLRDVETRVDELLKQADGTLVTKPHSPVEQQGDG